MRSILPSQVSNKIEKRRHAVATDRNGSEIRQDDTVRDLGGENKTGVILHIHRSFLFLHNREQTEDSGLFVARAANVATVAAKGGRVASQQHAGPDLARMNPALQANGGDKSRGSSMPPPTRTFGRDPALGKTVTIRKGPYKGLLGIVKDTTDSEARVELHTKGKIVQVVKDILSIKDAVTGNTVPYADFAARGGGGGGRGGGGSFGGGTPRQQPEWTGSRTPQAAHASGGRTPAWGSAMPARTPAWSGGSGGSGGGSGSVAASPRVPRWGQDSGRTPAWSNDGGRTSYGGGTTTYGGGTAYGAGGRTPAWNADGGRTAYGGPSSSASAAANDAYAGARTPAYGADPARTPAWSGGASYAAAPGGANAYGGSEASAWNGRPHDAPTPAAPSAGSAPTPGNPYGGAPTPAAAAASAPTPGKYGGYGIDAPTPAAAAPTPYAASAETPAAWAGEDEGPRYEESPSP